MPSPARKQYLTIKAQYPDAILLYQIGDFFETFDEDAHIAARELQIVLTQRDYGPDERVPLAGVPVHAVETYAARLISRGYKVAICEQIGEPNGRLVERAVTRILTPGTLTEPGMVPPKQNNYLAAVVFDQRGTAGLAHVDVSTGEFAATSFAPEALPAALEAEFHRLAPAECLVAETQRERLAALRLEGAVGAITGRAAHDFAIASAARRLCRQFQVASLAAYGCAADDPCVAAAAAILAYLEQMNPALLLLLAHLRTYATRSYMVLDGHTQRNLELLESMRGGGTRGSLLWTLDLTRTPMGGRLLRRWITQPLLDLDELQRRYDVVGELVEHVALRSRLTALVATIGDIERIAGRARQGTAVRRELLGLRAYLDVVPRLRLALEDTATALLRDLRAALDPCPEVADLIGRAIADSEEDGHIIRRGYSADLDALVDSISDSQQWLAQLEQVERERSGIKSLKVSYNKVFGYYIEVSKPNLPRVPPDYIRKQTLVNAERFITPALKDHEARILHAEERITEMEEALYKDVLRQIGAEQERLQATAATIAALDALVSFAEVAARGDYMRPVLDTSHSIAIEAGRHPVVERTQEETGFIPNDTQLGSDGPIMVLTGPNMAGKSTYLRQVALICLMAQIGSFVPARSAHIGLVDRIFTRVGAQDDIASGQSTFMVEMTETAAILHQATPRSLLILDEIGRGTATYDGLAIARAVLEHIHDRLGARTLFATHYHELADLAGALTGVRAYTMAITEDEDRIVLLHRVQLGTLGRSYGVHVARLAGMPGHIIRRAYELLAALEARPNPPFPFPKREGGDGDGASVTAVARLELPEEHLLASDSGSMPAPLPSANGLDAPAQAADGMDRSAALPVAPQPAIAEGIVPYATNNGYINSRDPNSSERAAPEPPDEVIDELLRVDIATMTPLEALNRLFALQQRARRRQGRSIP
jgi:DNA mismatch repair protein MutS